MANNTIHKHPLIPCFLPRTYMSIAYSSSQACKNKRDVRRNLQTVAYKAIVKLSGSQFCSRQNKTKPMRNSYKTIMEPQITGIFWESLAKLSWICCKSLKNLLQIFWESLNLSQISWECLSWISRESLANVLQNSHVNLSRKSPKNLMNLSQIFQESLLHLYVPAFYPLMCTQFSLC